MIELFKKVSVIVPAYNAAMTIKSTLKSLINQTYSNFEVIIVDDGSKDQTKAIVEDFCTNDNRIKYVYQENRGVSSARNLGIKNSTGTYLCFLDSDDYFDPFYLEKMINKIVKKQADVCYCGYSVVLMGNIKKKYTKFKDGDILLLLIQGKINVITSGWLIHRDLIIKNNLTFSEDISWGEDLLFFYSVISRTKNVTAINEHLTFYNFNHSAKQLSNFEINKINDDFIYIEKMINDKHINRNSKYKDSLVNYRFHGAIIYRLLNALDLKIELSVISEFYNEYRKYILKFTFNNGLRSLKLNLNRCKLILKYHIQQKKFNMFGGTKL